MSFHWITWSKFEGSNFKDRVIFHFEGILSIQSFYIGNLKYSMIFIWKGKNKIDNSGYPHLECFITFKEFNINTSTSDVGPSSINL
jgi:hypothetical protein